MTTPLVDPRGGDVEDDVSSTKRRSLFAIAGGLLAEVSLPKLAVAWVTLIVLPGVLLGLAPLVATGWLAAISRKIVSPYSGVWPFLLLVLVVTLGWFGGWPVFRAAEGGFWSLNSLVVQPVYAICREGFRHLAELLLRSRIDVEGRGQLRAACAAGAGLFLCGIALFLAWLAWPISRWVGDIADLTSPLRLVVPSLANTVVFLGTYLAVTSLVWGIADATMDQPRDLSVFDPPENGRSWRVVHLSDLHVVGERYGFRIESGRSGACGNERLARVLARLAAIHVEQPLDLLLITGDITDAGRWSGRNSSRCWTSTRIWRSGRYCCRAITTLMLSIVRIPPGSTCPPALGSVYASCVCCRPCPPYKATRSMSLIAKRTGLAARSPVRWRRTDLPLLRLPIWERSVCLFD